MKKVIIIGAGMAGLSAGSHLQMRGYGTEIFELGAAAGGLCTGWKRSGYAFDGCIHWLVGSRPSVSIYNLWNELVDMEHLDIVDYREYCAIEDGQGNRFDAYTDIDLLEQEMKRVSPDDARAVESFIRGIRTFLDFNLPVEKPMEFMSLSEKIAMAGGMAKKLIPLLKWMRMSNGDLAGRFRSPLIKRFLTSSYPADFSALITLINCGWLHKKGAGYPVGGSLKLVEQLERKYRECGGHIHYRSRVAKILVENHRACGVRLEDGREFRCDLVISAADGYSTIYELLEGRHTGKRIREIYEKGALRTQSPGMFVSIGVDRTFETEPHWIFLPLQKPIDIDGGTRIDELAVTIVNFDPTAAPEGKTCVTVMLSSNDCAYWTTLRKKNRERYLAEKKRVGDEIVQALERRFGNFAQHVEVCDVATPATYIRYTNNWKASVQGWRAGIRTMGKNVPRELPGLRDFYMAGQWVEIGGGVPMCMMSGRNVAQLICKRDGVEFGVKPQ